MWCHIAINIKQGYSAFERARENGLYVVTPRFHAKRKGLGEKREVHDRSNIARTTLLKSGKWNISVNVL